MNKFLVSCIVFCSVFLTSCIGPQGEQGERGPKGDPGEGMNWKIVDITVLESQWQLTNLTDNNYYYYTADVPALTAFIFDNGNINAYMVYDYDTDDPKQIVLPYTRPYNKDGLYTETIDYAFGVGWVEFMLRASDFKYETNPTYKPYERRFRLVLTW